MVADIGESVFHRPLTARNCQVFSESSGIVVERFFGELFFSSRTRSEQAAAAVAMRSKWKSELMRRRGKGRGDIFNVQHILNIYFARENVQEVYALNDSASSHA